MSKPDEAPRHRPEAIWAYAVEMLGAGCLTVLVWTVLDHRRVSRWMFDKRSDLVNLTIVAAATSGVIFAAYFALLATDFGKRLRVTGWAKEYAIAFAYPLLLFVFTALILTVISRPEQHTFMYISCFLLIYSALNCVNMVRNVIGLVGVWQDTEKARETGL